MTYKILTIMMTVCAGLILLSTEAQASRGQAAYVLSGSYYCLNVNDDKKVVGGACDETATTWVQVTKNRLQQEGTNNCMDVDTAHPANGNKVQVWDCSGTPVNQEFTWNGNGVITLNSKGLCVVPPASGAQATIAGCNAGTQTIMMTRRVILAPEWGEDVASVPVYLQGSETSALKQKLTVFGPDIPSRTETSNPSEAFGHQFFHGFEHVSYTPGKTYTFNVFIESEQNGSFLRSPVLVDNQEIPITNPSDETVGLMAYVGANDTGPDTGDQDFNDTMLIISIWNNSTD